MGFFKKASKAIKKSGSFNGKNKKAIADGLRHGAGECGKVMREWRKKKNK